MECLVARPIKAPATEISAVSTSAVKTLVDLLAVEAVLCVAALGIPQRDRPYWMLYPLSTAFVSWPRLRTHDWRT